MHYDDEESLAAALQTDVEILSEKFQNFSIDTVKDIVYQMLAYGEELYISIELCER